MRTRKTDVFAINEMREKTVMICGAIDIKIIEDNLIIEMPDDFPTIAFNTNAVDR